MMGSALYRKPIGLVGFSITALRRGRDHVVNRHIGDAVRLLYSVDVVRCKGELLDTVRLCRRTGA